MRYVADAYRCRTAWKCHAVASLPEQDILPGRQRSHELPVSPNSEYIFMLQQLREFLNTDPARRPAAERERVLVSFFDQLAAEARADG